MSVFAKVRNLLALQDLWIERRWAVTCLIAAFFAESLSSLATLF